MVVLETYHGYARFIKRKRLQILRPKERNKDLYAACLVNSWQGKDAGVLFRLNYSIHQHTGIDVIKVLDGRNYFQYS